MKLPAAHVDSPPYQTAPAAAPKPNTGERPSVLLVASIDAVGIARLPRLFHPLFAADVVERASQDRYFLVFPRDAALKPKIDAILQPFAVHEVID